MMIALIKGPQFPMNTGRHRLRWLSIALPVLAVVVLFVGLYSVSLPPDTTVSRALAPASSLESPSSAATTTQQPAVTILSEKENFILEAQPGDGVTHLARRAIQRFMASRPQATGLTPAHRIYMEDYLKDRIGSRVLHPGEDIQFDPVVIQEATLAARRLTQQQLDNLQRYVRLVPELQTE